MDFKSCKFDPDCWIKDGGDVYEYVCVYVDDLMAIMKDPDKFYKSLQHDHGYKLKNVGPPRYHLGGDFFQDPDGTWAWGAKTYIKRMVDNYKRIFEEDPKPYKSPLEKGDHPELDTSPELDAAGITLYQSLVGELGWCAILGRLDIVVHAAAMARFRAAPRQGHLERVKRIIGYLSKKNDAAIRFRTLIPQNEDHYEMIDYDWMYSVYGNDPEEIDEDIPSPKGKPVRTTTWVDANLMACMVTGKSNSGIIHFINQTPVDWFSKLQKTVETATYGSEFVAARIATEQIVDMRMCIRELGAPVLDESWMLGDNESVIKSSTIPSSVLNRRHNALSFHCVRSWISKGVLKFCHVSGKENISDILTKLLGFQQLWPIIEPLLFWRGETLQETN